MKKIREGERRGSFICLSLRCSKQRIKMKNNKRNGRKRKSRIEMNIANRVKSQIREVQEQSNKNKIYNKSINKNNQRRISWSRWKAPPSSATTMRWRWRRTVDEDVECWLLVYDAHESNLAIKIRIAHRKKRSAQKKDSLGRCWLLKLK